MTAPPRDEKAIFLTALEKSTPAEREAYLTEACAGDLQLLQHIRELLASHEGSLGPLDALPPCTGLPPTRSQPRTEHVGMQIGPYKLRQQIGEGGMGVVYVAEQKVPVARHVALKIIKPGMDSQQIVARFEAERQALAIMDHPNIAKVLDAGMTDTGRPYFVMELVNGPSINTYCDEQHLSPRERLELFVPICQAVQHAHQKGIIHRDLKPSNILVALYDGRPVPKVIDFGVAKAIGQALTDKSIFTQFGQVVGTLEYMSPEQAGRNQLDIDTRSDVYSLGIVLYELLTGDTPFDGQRLRAAAFDEMLRIIREEEPPTPSTKLSSSERLPTVAANRRTEPTRLRSLVRGELDWIVMKALEKERGRRYATASEFADDIHRYLHNEAVVACPPSRVYRFRKFAVRHKSVLMTVGLVMLALVLGIIASMWQARRAWIAEHAAVMALAGEQQQFARAEANFLKTLEAVDEFLSQVGEEDLASLPHFEPVRRRLLLKALAFFEGFLQKANAEPGVQIEAGLAARRVGDIQQLLGNHEAALEAYNRALALLKPTTGDHASQSITRQRDEALAHFGQGEALLDGGRRTEAEQAYIRARTIQEQLLAGDDASPSEIKYEMATTCKRLGRLYQGDGRNELAEESAQHAFRLLDELVREVPKRVEYPTALLDCINNLATAQRNRKKIDEATRSFERGMEFAEACGEQFEQDDKFRYAVVLLEANRAMFLRGIGDTTAGDGALRRGVAEIEQLSQDFPHIPRYRFGVFKFRVNAGVVALANNELAQAEEHLQRAVSVMEQLVAEFPAVVEYKTALGGGLNDLAAICEKRGDVVARRQFVERAIAVQRLALELDPQSTVARKFLHNHIFNLTQAVQQADASDLEADAALARATTAAQWLTQSYPDDVQGPHTLGWCLYRQAVRFNGRGDASAARKVCHEALQYLRAACQAEVSDATFSKALVEAEQFLAQLPQQ